MNFDDPSSRRLYIVRHGARALCFHVPLPPLNPWQRLLQRWRKAETETPGHVEGLNLLVADAPAIGSEAARRAAMAISRRVVTQW